jgi:hypothetical protein
MTADFLHSPPQRLSKGYMQLGRSTGTINLRCKVFAISAEAFFFCVRSRTLKMEKYHLCFWKQMEYEYAGIFTIPFSSLRTHH